MNSALFVMRRQLPFFSHAAALHLRHNRWRWPAAYKNLFNSYSWPIPDAGVVKNMRAIDTCITVEP